jgi:hypothetical protein
MEQPPDRSSQPSSGNLVAQVNMVPEDEPDDTGQWLASTPATRETISPDGDTPPARSNPLQALLLGALAIAIIAVSMFVILQGVFEMIPD